MGLTAMEANGLSGAVREAALAVAVGAGVLLGGAGFAEAVPQSHSFSVTGGGPESDVFAFQQFNPALGTLTAVTITVPSFAISHLSIASIGGGEFGDSVTVSQSGGLSLSRAAGALFSGSAMSGATCSVQLSGAGCSEVDFGTHPMNFLTPNFVSLTLQVDLDAFTGGGTVDLTAAITGYTASITTSQLGGSPIAGISGSQNFMQWSPTVEVDYTFSAIETVPEPASLVLFGTAIGLGGLLRRRRA